MSIPAAPPRGLTARSLWLELHRLTGASLLGIEDTAGLLTATNVEDALAELAAGIGLTDVSAAAATELTIAAGVIAATQTYHTIDTQGDAVSDDLDTINGLANGQFYVFGLQDAAHKVTFKHGTGNIRCLSGRDILLDVLNDKIFGFSNGTSLFVLDMNLASPANGGLANALGTLTNGQGASLVGIQDAGLYFTATTVEGALAEVAADVYSDDFVKAVVAVANAAAGATAALATIQLTQRDGATPLTSARQVYLVSNTTQYGGEGPTVAGITIGAITAGSVIATIQTSNFLVETNATGLFAATISNSADQTIYFTVLQAKGVSALAKACAVVGSNVDAATWSA